MIRKLSIACLICFYTSCNVNLAQTVEQTAGIYTAYPEPERVYTPTPTGFTPKYISHYGRHGSRWITDDERYTRVVEAFDSLHQLGKLTSLGEDVRGRVRRVAVDAVGRSGHLTPVGARQLRGIGLRMAENFPEVLNDSAIVRAVSSTSIRCIMSMMHCLDAIKETNPGITMVPTAYDRDMEYIAHTTPEGKFFNSEDAPWRPAYRKFVNESVIPDRLIASLVTDPQNWTHDQGYDMMMDLYWIASDMQNVDLDEDFYDIFTYDELYSILRAVNARMYMCNGPTHTGREIMANCAQNLLDNIVACADSALTQGTPSANLRFGHDTHLLRLLMRMEIDGANTSAQTRETSLETWRDYELSPMAANLQMIFYGNEDGTTLVKFLLNERETTLPIESVSGPYYRWEDVKRFWAQGK